jgi:hypothetical protein
VGKPYVTKKVVKTVHHPTKKQSGDLNMCAFTAAGLVTGGSALEAFMDYGAPVDGATIPDALAYMGAAARPCSVPVPGAVLGLPNHAVVIEDTDDDGAWVWSWGQLYFIGWDYIAINTEDAWRISGLTTGCST